MDVIVLIAENQEEEEEEPDADPKAALKKQLGNDSKKNSEKKGDKAAKPADADEEAEIQRLANDMGLDHDDELSPDIQDEMADENEPDKPNLDDEHDSRGHFAPLDLGEPESEKKPKAEPKVEKEQPEPIDVFNEPLIPDDMNPHRGSNKKK